MGTRGLHCVWLKHRCIKAKRIKGDAYPECWGYLFFRTLKRVNFLEEEQASAEVSLAKLEGRYDYCDDDYDVGDVLPTPLDVEEKLQRVLTLVNDGLYCEWVYVVDLDSETFEVYQGSASGIKTKDHRFENVGDELATVPKLVGAFDIKTLASMSGLQFLFKVFKACENYEPSLIDSLHPYD